MVRITRFLAVVLGLQILAALAFMMSGQRYSAFEAEEPLVAVTDTEVDQIAIKDGGGNTVTLNRSGEGWAIAEFDGYPASDGKVKGMLKKLLDLKKGWPVANTSSAAERFKVSDGTFEREVTLLGNGGELGTLRLGTSPAFRQIHARSGNDSEVYNVKFATFDVPAEGRTWADRAKLAVNEDTIEKIAVAGIELVSKGKDKDRKFELADLKPDEEMDLSAVARVLGALTQPSFDAVVGKGKDAIGKTEKADLEVTISRKDAAPVVYRYKKEAVEANDADETPDSKKTDEDKSTKDDQKNVAYLFSVSGQDYLFKTSAGAISDLTNVKRDKLAKKKEKKKETPPAQTKAPGVLPETTPAKKTGPALDQETSKTGKTDARTSGSGRYVD